MFLVVFCKFYSNNNALRFHCAILNAHINSFTQEGSTKDTSVPNTVLSRLHSQELTTWYARINVQSVPNLD